MPQWEIVSVAPGAERFFEANIFGSPEGQTLDSLVHIEDFPLVEKLWENSALEGAKDRL